MKNKTKVKIKNRRKEKRRPPDNHFLIPALPGTPSAHSGKS